MTKVGFGVVDGSESRLMGAGIHVSVAILILDFWGFCWRVVADGKGAKSVREGNLLKLEVAQFKSKFGERAQALIPRDLHTNSVIVYRTCSVFSLSDSIMEQ
ncbi:hypothetical protein Droror1_Dr00012274 [Drosera rotundifolia]